MADKEEYVTIDSEAQEVSEKEVSKPKSEKAKKSGASKGFVFLLFLLIMGLYAGGYWLWQQQNKVNGQVGSSLSKLAEPVVAPVVKFDSTSLEQSIKTVEQSIDTVNSQITALDDSQKTLVESVNSLSEEKAMSGGDVEYHWAMSEIKHLLNVANQQVLLAQNARRAEVALSLADSRVEALHDYRLHPLRALLASDMLALSSITEVDIAGLNLKLQSALAAVDSLQVVMAESINDSTDEPVTHSNDAEDALNKVWQEMKSLVVIRHQEEGATAVLVPEQRYFLFQNLSLKLESARLALLSGEQSVFDASVQSAISWLTLYFEGDKRDAMLSLLTALDKAKIESSLPDISASLIWLQEFDQ